MPATPLCRCRVLYIGSAVPTITKDGLQGIQEPLKELYTVDQKLNTNKGIDAWLCVWSNGITREYIEDDKKSDAAFFPIQSLHYCAAVRYVNVTGYSVEGGGERFLPLDSPFAQVTASKHPPLFAAMLRKTTGIKVLECHAFICTNPKAANALVRCCFHAYADSIYLKQENLPELQHAPNQPRALKARDTSSESSPAGSVAGEFNGYQSGAEDNDLESREVLRWSDVKSKQQSWQRRQQSGDLDSYSISSSVGDRYAAGKKETSKAPSEPGGAMVPYNPHEAAYRQIHRTGGMPFLNGSNSHSMSLMPYHPRHPAAMMHGQHMMRPPLALPAPHGMMAPMPFYGGSPWLRHGPPMMPAQRMAGPMTMGGPPMRPLMIRPGPPPRNKKGKASKASKGGSMGPREMMMMRGPMPFPEEDAMSHMTMPPPRAFSPPPGPYSEPQYNMFPRRAFEEPIYMPQSRNPYPMMPPTASYGPHSMPVERYEDYYLNYMRNGPGIIEIDSKKHKKKNKPNKRRDEVAAEAYEWESSILGAGESGIYRRPFLNEKMFAGTLQSSGRQPFPRRDMLPPDSDRTFRHLNGHDQHQPQQVEADMHNLSVSESERSSAYRGNLGRSTQMAY